MTKTPELTDEQLASFELDYDMWRNIDINAEMFAVRVRDKFPALIAYARQRNELLEALEGLKFQIRDEVDDLQDNVKKFGDNEFTHELNLWNALNAAIARAKGEA